MEEPWISIEGALYDVKAGAAEVHEALGWIKEYLAKAGFGRMIVPDTTSSTPTITISPEKP